MLEDLQEGSEMECGTQNKYKQLAEFFTSSLEILLPLELVYFARSTHNYVSICAELIGFLMCWRMHSVRSYITENIAFFH
jgi:hypothetical protein